MQKGFIRILALLMLIIGIGVGLFLVSQQQIFKPKASVDKPVVPQTSLSLSPQKAQFSIGEEIRVDVLVRSDIDSSNLFSTKVIFPANILEVNSLETENSFVKLWVERNFDNKNGTVAVTGGLPSPGFQSSVKNKPSLLATIVFKAKATGDVNLQIDDGAAIYRNLDNVNILSIKENTVFKITNTPAPSASDNPTFSTPFLSLEPEQATLSKGCNYQIKVKIGTAGQASKGVDAVLGFDSNRFLVNSITNGSLFPSYPNNIIDNSRGFIAISGLTDIHKDFSGQGVLATINFSVKPSAANGRTIINFDFDSTSKLKTNDSNIVGSKILTDILDRVQNGSYLISAGACP